MRVITPTQQAILGELARDGATDKVIAERLGMSPKTVKTHLTTIRAKSGLRTRTALAVWWVRTRECDPATHTWAVDQTTHTWTVSA